ncbi:MAG: glycosyltransferase family 2 protein [Thermoproteota archaeon]
MLGSKDKVSVILPAYNEESTIEEAVRRTEEVLKRIGFNYEIIIVNDGSTDNTISRALKCANNNHHVKVVSHLRNLGKGAAVRTGFAHSSGDRIVFMDSDLEIDQRGLKAYIDALGNADVAIGSKWHPNSMVETPFIRMFLSRVFYALTRLLTGVKASDTQAGLKVFRREALGKIMRMQLVKRYAFDVELLASASLLNLKIAELPVNMRLKAGFKPIEILRMLLELLGIACRLRLTKWYQRGMAEASLNTGLVARSLEPC